VEFSLHGGTKCLKNRHFSHMIINQYLSHLNRADAWTPQQHSALIWPVPPEAKPARATLASTRARTSAFSARRVTRRSVPRKARHSTACGRQQKPSLSCS